MASLQARLIVGLTTLVLAASLPAGGLAFRWAFDEAIELQDAILRQVGVLAANNRLAIDPASAGDIDAEARVVIEELGDAASGTNDINLALPPLPDGLPDGLQTISRGSEMWRLLLRTRTDGSRVAISQLTANRDEIARDSALRTILPLAMLVPFLLLIVGLVVHYSFRPVSRLAARLDVQQSDQPETLPVEGLPKELLPFIASINRLLARIGILVDQQCRFIADAAHELRTPITALSLQAENLDHTALSPEGRERLTILKTGIHRTARLLEQLLDLARYESASALQKPVTAFDLVIRDAMADYLPLALPRAIDLGFERIEPLSVRADATALGVMVRNLIDNALRHSPEGGRIDVYLFRDGDQAVFRIEDMGSGIPDTELEQVFEPFVRGAHPKGEGSGLGLSIVRRIAGNHGGSIIIENLSGPSHPGLRVTVSLPVADLIAR